jgi:hypothetical protein
MTIPTNNPGIDLDNLREEFEAWSIAERERSSGHTLDAAERGYLLRRLPDDHEYYNYAPAEWPAFCGGYRAALARQAAPVAPTQQANSNSIEFGGIKPAATTASASQEAQAAHAGAVEKDAARYRFLRDHGDTEGQPPVMLQGRWYGGSNGVGFNLDKAVDAAIAASEQKGPQA